MDYVKKGRHEKKQRVEQELASQHCFICGEDSPSALRFVGEGWQSVPITDLVRRNVNWSTLLTVMSESTVSCLNCAAKIRATRQLEKMAAGV